jgi:hypothetical protein
MLCDFFKYNLISLTVVSPSGVEASLKKIKSHLKNNQMVMSEVVEEQTNAFMHLSSVVWLRFFIP